MQRCLNENPGRKIVLKKWTASNRGGGTATRIDYYSSITLELTGNGQSLEGDVNFGWSGAVRIRFATNIPGIRIPATCYACAIKYLEIEGQSCWNGTPSPPSQGGDGPDGIQLMGGEPELDHVGVNCFARNGILVSGDSAIQPTSQPDNWVINRVQANANWGHGIRVIGGDSNAGVGTNLDVRRNQLSGISDESLFGNVWIGAMAHSNGRSYSGRPGYSSSYSTWIGPYCEIGQAPPDFGSSAMIVGGNCRIQRPLSGVVLGVLAHSLEVQSRGVKFFNNVDEQNLIDLYAGKNATYDRGIRWMGIDGKEQFRMYQWEDHYLTIKNDQDNFRLVFDRPGNTYMWPSPGYRTYIGSTLQVDSKNAAPVCYQPNRGMVHIFFGTSGQKDSVAICLKDANESWNWRAVSTQ